MKYKTWFYNVEPIANRLPDDCLKIVISYCYDELPYMYLKNYLSRLDCDIELNRNNQFPTFRSSRYCVGLSMKYNYISITDFKSETHWRYTLNYVLISIAHRCKPKNLQFTYFTVKYGSDINWYVGDNNYLIVI